MPAASAAVGTLTAESSDVDDLHQPAEGETTRPREGTGGGGLVPAGGSDHGQTVRRRRSRPATQRKAWTQSDDPAANAGAAGTSAAIEHSGRFGTFPDPTAQSEELFCSNLGLARKVAWKWVQSTGLAYDDIESVAMRGLLRGCRKYNPSRINPYNGQPYALSSAVVPFIHGELLHEFRDKPYAIRYPARWREKYGLVMRMLEEHATHEQIGEAAGMPAREVEELIEAMCRPGELNDELHGGDAPVAELDLLAPLQDLLTMAWDDMPAADQALIVKWWDTANLRTPFPSGPFQQMDKRLARMLNGRRLPQLRQLKLLDLPEVAVVANRQRRQRKAQLGQVIQLALAET